MATVDYSTWLTKQAAADAIGVSTKTVEKLAADQKLQQAVWKRPTGGPALAVYHPGDVARIALQRQPEAAAFVLPAVSDRANGNGHDNRLNGSATALAVTSPLAPGDDVLRALFAAALRAVTSESSQNHTRLFLTLPEASAVSGLSQGCLRRMIAAGSLPAMRDRGWRIRRRDLEAL